MFRVSSIYLFCLLSSVHNHIASTNTGAESGQNQLYLAESVAVLAENSEPLQCTEFPVAVFTYFPSRSRPSSMLIPLESPQRMQSECPVTKVYPFTSFPSSQCYSQCSSPCVHQYLPRKSNVTSDPDVESSLLPDGLSNNDCEIHESKDYHQEHKCEEKII